MAKGMLKKHLWILNKLYTTGGISYKDLVKEWEHSVLNDEGTTIDGFLPSRRRPDRTVMVAPAGDSCAESAADGRPSTCTSTIFLRVSLYHLEKML